MPPRPLSVRAEIKQGRPFRAPSEEATIALLRTADQLHRRLSQVVAAAGVTRQQYNVLRILRGSHPEPLPTLEVATRMIEETPGITRLLDRLEAKGLVARDRGRDDRRCVRCTITRAGLDVLAALDAPTLAAVEEVFASLGHPGTRDLTARLDQLRDALRTASSEAPKGDAP